MTIELDAGRYAERRPGDFKRRATDGAPYVSDPTGALVKSGERKGEPKWALYGRPSGFGKQIENAYNLIKWKERMLVLGCAGPEVASLAEALVGQDPSTAEWRSKADGVVAAAYRAAKAMEAAERGTHMHEATEDDDRDRDWVARAEAGEDLGIPTEVQASMVDAWRAMLATYDIEVLAVEVPVVNDEYRQAGTLDRVARLGRPLTFTVAASGEVVTLPAGLVVILDLKTGRMTLDGGIVRYWHTYAIQVATYAASKPYDVATETRTEWEWPIDQRWGLIAHLPVLEALEGAATCRLILVDLEAGHHAARLCQEAAEWERRKDLFGMANDELVTAAGKTELETQLESSLARLDPYRLWGPLPDGYDEGRITDDALRSLVKRVDALAAEARAVLEQYARQAHEVGRSFSVRKVPSVRRSVIYRALLVLAEHYADGLDDDLVRATVAHVLPEAGQLAIPLGAAIGSLDPAEARRVLDVAVAVTVDGPALTFSDDGSPRWDLVA